MSESIWHTAYNDFPDKKRMVLIRFRWDGQEKYSVGCCSTEDSYGERQYLVMFLGTLRLITPNIFTAWCYPEDIK